MNEEVLAHIEHYLGEYSDCSGISFKGERLSVSVFSFDEPPLAIYVSYGLSNAKWQLEIDHVCRFELIAANLNDGSNESDNLKMLLIRVAND
jgi:hypothetical protein